MKFVKQLVAIMLLLFLAACGGGGSGGNVQQNPNPNPSSTGTITGKVSSNADGSAVVGAAVKVGTLTATTASDGTYTISNVPTGSGKVVTVTKTGYVLGSKIATVVANTTTRTNVTLLPVAYTTTFDPSGANTLTVPGSTASVALTANALRTASGAAPAGSVTANLTPLDPSSSPQLMPGNYTTSAGQVIESFGAMEVTFTDNSGSALNLASGQSATIRIPVAANSSSAPATIPAFYYNSTTGQWVQEGTLTLAGSSPNQYYTGTVTHFSYWNADQPLQTTCISGKVVNASGAPVANARVEAEGRDYIGTSEAYTAADGTFSVLVKSESSVIVTAITSDAVSQSEIVDTGTGNICTSLPSNLTLGSNTSSVKIKLTWGSAPSDLDSHLTGPDPNNSGSRFHVYYSSEGSVGSAPYAELDVDDTSSFGPEIITITRFFPGTYRYSVHHYSGSGNIYTSPARVELNLNGAITIFTPPAPGNTTLSSGSVWQVFELVVASNGTVTVNRLDNYLTGISAGSVPKALTGELAEKYLYSNLPRK